MRAARDVSSELPEGKPCPVLTRAARPNLRLPTRIPNLATSPTPDRFPPTARSNTIHIGDEYYRQHNMPQAGYQFLNNLLSISLFLVFEFEVG